MTRSARVVGVQSPAGVIHHPAATHCRFTGVRLGVGATRRFAAQQRPAVAVVVWDDGTSRSIWSDVLVGSDAANDVVLRDQQHSVSARHARFEFDGWQLRVRDLGATNGTWRRDSDGRCDDGWRRLLPDRPYPVADGDRFAFGRRWCTVRLLI